VAENEPKHTLNVHLCCINGEASVLAFPEMLRMVADQIDNCYTALKGTKRGVNFEYELKEMVIGHE
jgi:hypothetical protein